MDFSLNLLGSPWTAGLVALAALIAIFAGRFFKGWIKDMKQENADKEEQKKTKQSAIDLVQENNNLNDDLVSSRKALESENPNP